MEQTYKIVRFYSDEYHPEHRKVVRTGLTLAEAQEHCKRDDTRGKRLDGIEWFDGYTEEAAG